MYLNEFVFKNNVTGHPSEVKPLPYPPSFAQKSRPAKK